MKLSKQHLLYTTISAVITVAFGILLAAKPWILEKICTWAGGVFCLAGVVLCILYFVRKQQNSAHLTYGLISLVIGILLCIVPSVLKFLVPVLFGLWILISAGSGILRNIANRRVHSLWWVGLLLSIIGAAIGVYTITRPVYALQTTIKIIGIALILQGVLRLVSAFMGRKVYISETEDVIETTIK